MKRGRAALPLQSELGTSIDCAVIFAFFCLSWTWWCWLLWGACDWAGHLIDFSQGTVIVSSLTSRQTGCQLHDPHCAGTVIVSSLTSRQTGCQLHDPHCAPLCISEQNGVSHSNQRVGEGGKTTPARSH